MPKPHTATKACPHHWCRPLHLTASTAGGLALIALAVRQPWFLLLLIALVVLSTAMYAAITRKTLRDIAAEDLAPIAPLVVRPGWACTAVALDAAIALLAPAGLLAALVAPPGAYAAQAAAGGPLPIVAIVAFSVFHRLAHYLATRPARPKRVLAPVPN